MFFTLAQQTIQTYSLLIEILQNRKYFGFSQLILGYKKRLQLKFRDNAFVNSKYIKQVGQSILNVNAP